MAIPTLHETSLMHAQLRAVAGKIEKASDFLERRFWLCGSLFSILLLISGLAVDVRKRLWLDELFTLYIARQGSFAEIVKAVWEGCDGQPPFYAFLVHILLPWVHPEAVAIRLPSTLGYCGLIFFLLAFCRGRLPALYAFVATASICVPTLLYLSEGRAYGIGLCVTAAALFFWQRAPTSLRPVALPCLAVSLAVMTALHYYAIFSLVPLVLGEFMRWGKSGKLDLPVLGTMLTIPAVLAAHYPIIAAGKKFTAHYWSPAGWNHIIPTYYPYARVVFLMTIVLAIFSMLPAGRGDRRTRLTQPEWVVLGASLGVPLLVIISSIFVTHIYVFRYSIWAAPGIAILLGALLCLVARGREVIGLVVLGLACALIAQHEFDDIFKKPPLSHSEEILAALQRLPARDEPIVLSGVRSCLEVFYYAEPRLRSRLVCSISRNLDLLYRNADTDALLFSALSHRTNIPNIQYDEVLAKHKRFILASEPVEYQYLSWHLVRSGFSVMPIDGNTAGIPLLFEVQQNRN